MFGRNFFIEHLPGDQGFVLVKFDGDAEVERKKIPVGDFGPAGAFLDAMGEGESWGSERSFPPPPTQQGVDKSGENLTDNKKSGFWHHRRLWVLVAVAGGAAALMVSYLI